MTAHPPDVYAAFLDGVAVPHLAARALLIDLAETESELQPLQTQRDALRAMLTTVLAECEGRRVVLDGYGTARLADAAMVKRWNDQRLAHLCAWLRETDREEIAEMIEACREAQPRAGGLRVERTPA